MKADLHHALLAEKSAHRASECWEQCGRPCRVWIHEVQFGNRLTEDSHLISSKDYPGPVPGFCWAHLTSGPTRLAEAVYFDRAELLWFRPTYWFVVFTDGTRTGGECLSFDPPTTVITEEYKPSED